VGSILGSCGFPVPNTLSKIVDVETGKLLGPNQVLISPMFYEQAAFPCINTKSAKIH